MNVARWLIARFVSDDWRESIEGDLEEERGRRRAEHQPAGPFWAMRAAIVTLIKLNHDDRRSHMASVRSNRQSFSAAAWMQDVKLAVRGLRAAPAFTIVALLVLTLGIGASTAIFSVVDAVVLRPLPFDQSDRLVVVGEYNMARSGTPVLGTTTAPTFADWKSQQTVFQNVGAVISTGGLVATDSGRPERLAAQKITTGFFEALRVSPRVGRLFAAQDEVRGHDQVVIISDALWRSRFNANPSILGQTMMFDTGAREIIGVMPPEFSYPPASLKPTQIFVPFAPYERNDLGRTGGRNYFLSVVARLNDGVSIEQARSQIDGITKRLALTYPKWFKDYASGVESFHEVLVGRTRAWMLLMLGAVAFVLLIACVNVANLMLVRTTTRVREIAIRAALGATRWQIARGLLVESVVLSMAGTVCALFVASWGVQVLKAEMPVVVPRIASIGIDMRVLLAAAIASLVTGLCFGLAPALQFSRPNLAGVIGEGGRSGMAGRDRQRLRSALVVAEVALAVILLVGAGLFVSSFRRLINVELGLDYHNVLVAEASPNIDTRNPKWFEEAMEGTPAIAADVLQKVRAIPGVEFAALVNGGLPLSGSSHTNSITVPGKPTFDGNADAIDIRNVTPDYGRVIRAVVRRGRYLDATDVKGAPMVAVINEEAVRRFFAGQDPIGVAVDLDDHRRTIVGVVADVRLRGPEVPIQPEAYLPFAQTDNIGGTLAVRTNGDPTRLSAAVHNAIQSALPNVALADPATMESSLQRMLAQRKFNMLLIGLFGVLAVVIAAVGIYGVMAYIVAQQRKEIGLRMALGALPRAVLRMVLVRALTFMVLGTGAGLVGAWWLAGSVNAFLFQVQPHDPAVYLSVAFILVVSGMAAAIVPALRASQVDPMLAMRVD